MSDPNTSLNILKSLSEEIVTEDELVKLLAEKRTLIAYDGFEPSGKIHIAQGLLRAININKVIQAGFDFNMLVADWHAWANHKMGGDLNKIRTVGEYFIEVWKACGLDLSHVNFVWAGDLVKTPGYWDTVMKIAVEVNLPRVIRTVEIMGRSESDSLTASQILYPLMQASDIFILKADLAQLGMDQRKVNMLAREVGEKLGFKKPVVASHHMLMGLLPPDGKTENETATERGIRFKMSKSKPDSAIFMTDTADEITRKINNAWCPEGEPRENPILEYFKYIIFEKYPQIEISRPEKFGGNLSFASYSELETLFTEKGVHPQDLKIALANYIIELLAPIQNHFTNNESARLLKKKVESFQVTR